MTPIERLRATKQNIKIEVAWDSMTGPEFAWYDMVQYDVAERVAADLQARVDYEVKENERWAEAQKVALAEVERLLEDILSAYERGRKDGRSEFIEIGRAARAASRASRTDR